jgi:hypothetical protein
VKQRYGSTSKTGVQQNTVFIEFPLECLPLKLNGRGRSVTVQSKHSVLASGMELERNSKATVPKSSDPAAIVLE